MRDKLVQYTAKQRMLFRQEQAAFQQVFHVPLKRYWDFDNVIGFDIVSFDDFLEVPDGMSMAKHLQEQYGPDAVALVKRLVGMEN